jgi:hypothetical protein
MPVEWLQFFSRTFETLLNGVFSMLQVGQLAILAVVVGIPIERLAELVMI